MLRDLYFIGVGEACDPLCPNTSLLLRTEDGRGPALLDCGFTTPHLYFRTCTDSEELRALWISHFHGDHFFGVPLLLLRFWEMGRKDPLIILGPCGVQGKIEQAMDLAYPNFRPSLNYGLDFQEMESGSPTVEAGGLAWTAASSRHAAGALAIRVTDQRKSLFYSGDGRPTDETRILAAGCDVIVHEAFGLNKEAPDHGSIVDCLDFARQAGVKNLALLHINRHVRHNRRTEISKILDEAVDLNVFLPETGSSFVLG
jgi:ribonuclease Z